MLHENKKYKIRIHPLFGQWSTFCRTDSLINVDIETASVNCLTDLIMDFKNILAANKLLS